MDKPNQREPAGIGIGFDVSLGDHKPHAELPVAGLSRYWPLASLNHKPARPATNCVYDEQPRKTSKEKRQHHPNNPPLKSSTKISARLLANYFNSVGIYITSKVTRANSAGS